MKNNIFFLNIFLEFTGMRFAITQIKAALVGIIKNFEIIQKVVKDDVNTATNSLFITDNKTIVGFKKINTNSE